MTFLEAKFAAEGGQLIRRSSWPATTSNFLWLVVDRGLWFSDQYVLTNGRLTGKGLRGVVTAFSFTASEFQAQDWTTEAEFLASNQPPATAPLPSPPTGGGSPGSELPAPVPTAFRIDLRALNFERGISVNRYALYVLPLNGGSPYSIGFLRISGASLIFREEVRLTPGDSIEVIGIGTLRSIPWEVTTTASGNAPRRYAGGGGPWSIRTPHVSYYPFARSAGTFPIQP